MVFTEGWSLFRPDESLSRSSAIGRPDRIRFASTR